MWMRYIKEPSRDFIFHSVFRCVLNVSVVRAFARLFISMIRFFVFRRRRLLRLIFCLYLLWSIILGVFIGFVLKNWMACWRAADGSRRKDHTSIGTGLTKRTSWQMFGAVHIASQTNTTLEIHRRKNNTD